MLPDSSPNTRIHEGGRFTGRYSRFNACRTSPRLVHRRTVGELHHEDSKSTDQQDEDANAVADSIHGNVTQCLDLRACGSFHIGARKTSGNLKRDEAPWPC
jgi:hypothetical protein